MSFFLKPTSQLTATDLLQLKQDRPVENIRLEFKSEAPQKQEILKKLSSFANTFGGILIVGAAADSSDGRLQDLCGVDNQPGYRQKITQWCFDAISPPLSVEVSEGILVPDSEDKYCYVIAVSESDLAPHFLNGRKGVWVRTDEFSQRYDPVLAEENEIRYLLDRRKVIRERHQSILERSRRRSEYLISGGKGSRGVLRLGVAVSPRFPVHHICDQGHLRQILHDSLIPWRQVTFPPHHEPLSQHESILCVTPWQDDDVLSVELSTWGHVYYGVRLAATDFTPSVHEHATEESVSGINAWSLSGHLLACFRHAHNILDLIGYVGPLRVDVSLEGIRDLRLVFPRGGSSYSFAESGNIDDQFVFGLDWTAADFANRDAAARAALRLILFGMNASDHASEPQVGRLIEGGSKYNHWR